MRPLHGPAAALTVLVLATGGCSTTGSTDLGTGAMTATIVVVVGEMDTQVAAVLSADGLTSVELRGDDELEATSGEVTAALGHDSFLGSDSYAGRLDRVTDPGTEVTVALRRERGSAPGSTPGSTVRLPEPIFVVQPKPADRVPRGRDLVVGTNAGAGAVRVEWTGSCVDDGSLDLAEGAPVVVPARSVLADEPDATCDVTWTVSRIATGELDPAYAGGSITAQRSVSVTVSSVP